jgi:membrane protein DedA with SNARE-associated domain
MAAGERLDFVARNRARVPLVVAVPAAAGTTVPLSFVVFPVPVIRRMGALVSTGTLDFGTMLASAAIGVLIGSTLSWWVGHALGQAGLGLRPFELRPEATQKGLDARRRRGSRAVFLAHVFAPPTSGAAPVAGMLRLPAPHHRRANVPAVPIRAWCAIVLGRFGGDVIGRLWQ